jgi:hypothetical protein
MFDSRILLPIIHKEAFFACQEILWHQKARIGNMVGKDI